METIIKNITVGRRKESVARIFLYPGKGNLLINNIPYEQYLTRETDRLIVKQPMRITNTLTKYDVKANVRGGGLTGQVGALRHGISRALVAAEPELKDILRKSGFLTRDPRAKERKKYGQKGARKRFQWTKR